MQSLLQTIYKNEPDLVEKVKAFVDRGDDLNSVTEYGESALRVASNLGRFDVVALLLKAGADRAQLQWNDVISAVVYGDTNDIRKAVEASSDIESTDRWSRTPYLFAIQIGDIEKAALLLALGANRHAVGLGGKTPWQYAIDGDHVPMLQWLLDQGYEIDGVDDFLRTPVITAAELGRATCLQFLISAGADIGRRSRISENAIGAARSLEVVRILLSNGADVNDLGSEMRAELLGIGYRRNAQCTYEQYLTGRLQRFGASNPDEVSDPFCISMVRSGASGWGVSETFAENGGSLTHPIWNYDRMGRTTTILPDGRIVEIAGEHEDSYDPDFCIYNDVAMFDTDGTIRLFGYPEEVFPPTDFHSATLVDDFIVIIGSLGYLHTRRPGFTPVYRLNIHTFVMEKIETTGECPGWIHRHKATLDQSGRIVVTGGSVDLGEHKPFLENLDDWLLDTDSWNWSRATDCGWQQWQFMRKDRRVNHLWNIRQAIWSKNSKRNDEFVKDMSKLKASLGHEPDLDLVALLYEFDKAHGDVSPDNTYGRDIRAQVDGVALRIEEDHFGVHVVVEGTLPDGKLAEYQGTVLARLACLEGVDWEVVTMQ